MGQVDYTVYPVWKNMRRDCLYRVVARNLCWKLEEDQELWADLPRTLRDTNMEAMDDLLCTA